ncbi:MAG TPA: arginine--tRNA ligase, partial [Planctomycetaceae bacterium]|nr:arginine--tRNA ligase [Planctomycetaceae bacterium]
MNALSELRRRFEKVLAELTPDPAPFVAMVKPTQDATFGDFQANCAMPLAKQLGTNPRAVATEIVGKLDVADLCQPPEVAGPGFINIRLNDDWLAQQINRNVADPRLGVESAVQPKRVVIDYSAPNVAKPMHVGHLRSTVLGNSLYRIFKFCGHHVVGDNHIGDWGTQFGMILFGYKNFRDEAAFQREPVAELARLYRLVSQLSGYHDAKEELPNAICRLEELEVMLKSAEANKPSGDKQAEKVLKKFRSDVTEVREQIAGLRKQIDGVESSPRLRELAEQHPQIVELARRETAMLHAGDEENNRLWNQFVPQCLQAI